MDRRLRPDLLLAVDWLRHHDHLLVLPEKTHQPHRIRYGRWILELRFRNPGRYWGILRSRIHGASRRIADRRSCQLWYWAGLRRLPTDYFRGTTGTRTDHRRLVLRVIAVRRVYLHDFDPGSHPVCSQGQDRLVTPDRRFHLRGSHRTIVADRLWYDLGSTPAGCVGLLRQPLRHRCGLVCRRRCCFLDIATPRSEARRVGKGWMSRRGRRGGDKEEQG